MRHLSIHQRVHCLALCTSLTLALVWPVAQARAQWRSLTGFLPQSARFVAIRISPDSRYVVYLADVDIRSHPELYSVPLAGGAPIKLNPSLVPGGSVQEFRITPDGRYVIYTADQDTDEQDELYRVPIAGGSTVKLNQPIVTGGSVDRFEIDPDNVRVVYRADGGTNNVWELYSAPLGRGSVTKLTPTPVSGGSVRSFAIEPLSNRVVYLGDMEVDQLIELYSVPIAGGAVVKLSPANGLPVQTFALNPQIPVAVFSVGVAGLTGLYSNAVSGGLLAPLTSPLVRLASESFMITPDGARVIYAAVPRYIDWGTTHFGMLHSNLIGGGADINLTPGAATGYGLSSPRYEISPDSQRVIYQFQSDSGAAVHLETVSLAGTNRAILFSVSPVNHIDTVNVSPDGQWVVYGYGAPMRVESVPVFGGTRAYLAEAKALIITPDSRRVLYLSDGSTGPSDLYSVQIFSGGWRNLSQLDADQDPIGIQVSPDGAWITYVVSDPVHGRYDLRISDGQVGQSQSVYLPYIQR